MQTSGIHPGPWDRHLWVGNLGTGTRTGFPGWGWGSPGCSSLIINTAQRTLSRPGGARGCARVSLKVFDLVC